MTTHGVLVSMLQLPVLGKPASLCTQFQMPGGGFRLGGGQESRVHGKHTGAEETQGSWELGKHPKGG